MTEILTPNPGANRNPYKGIRKQRKGQWVYDCSLCRVSTPPATDLFGASEAKSQHIKSTQHTVKTMEAIAEGWERAAGTLVGAFGTIANTIVDSVMPVFEEAGRVFEEVGRVFATPNNLPHDPSLLADKRKWGGR